MSLSYTYVLLLNFGITRLKEYRSCNFWSLNSSERNRESIGSPFSNQKKPASISVTSTGRRNTLQYEDICNDCIEDACNDFIKKQDNRPAKQQYYPRLEECCKLQESKSNFGQQGSNPPPARVSGFVKNCNEIHNSHLAKGQKVRVCTVRPNREQFNGCDGVIVTIVDNNIGYVRMGKFTPCFYLSELVAVVEV